MSRRALGLHPIGPIAAELVADLQFQRKVQRLHQLGPRVVGEFLAELGAERGIAAVIEVAGGREFWPVPVRKIRS